MLRAGNFKRAATCDAVNSHIGQKFIRRSRIDALIAGRGMPAPCKVYKSAIYKPYARCKRKAKFYRENWRYIQFLDKPVSNFARS